MKWSKTYPQGINRNYDSVGIGNDQSLIQVRSGLTKASEADVNVITTDAAGIWVSTDHRCIVWCKQLVMALKRALFDVIGKNFAF